MSLSNSFDNGTIGLEVSVANSGASGDPFDFATDFFYDALAFKGAASGRAHFALSGPQLRWNLTGLPRQAFVRAAVYIPTAYGIGSGLAIAVIGGIYTELPFMEMEVVYDALAVPPLIVRLSADGTFVPFTTIPPRQSWFRIEGAYIDGNMEGRLALDPFAAHTESQTAIVAGGSDLSVCDIAANGAGDSADDWYADEIGVSRDGWLGPYVPEGQANRIGGIVAIRRPPRFAKRR